MKTRWDSWVGDTVQLVCRTGAGIEGVLLDFDDVWLCVKQKNGVDSLVLVADLIIVNHLPKVQLVGPTQRITQ